MKMSSRISGVLRVRLTGLVFLLMLALVSSNAANALTQTASPATCASIAGIGTVAWTNPTRAISSNNSYATASVDGTTTRYLRCTGYNFAIPAGATINGITVNVERWSSSTANGGSRDAAVRVVKAGVIGATDRSTATIYTTADVIEAHGGVADLWGSTWLPSDINAANFGAAFAATKASAAGAAGAAHTVSVDHVQITVDYSLPPGIYSLAASPATCASVAGIGTVAWTNPTRAISSNNSYATASLDGTTSRYLRCTGYNFAIPAGATINGITVNVERKSNRTSNGGSKDAAMRVVKAGVIGATDRSTATIYTTADVIEAHGGVADLWGSTWLPSDINAVNFGAAFAATKASAAGAAHTVSVDHMPITVTFTIGAIGPDHIRITHDGNGLTCTPAILTVIACANAACTTPHYTASAVTGNVIWTGAPGGSVAFNITTGGTATVSLPVTTMQTVTLGTSAVNPAETNPPSTCWNTGNATASCSLPFADSALLVSAPNHVSETVQNMTISAVRKANNALNCVPAFANVSRAVNLKCMYANPTTGNVPVRVAGVALNTGNNAAAACDATGQSPTLAFNASGTATATLQYADVGQMTLNATYTGSAGTGNAGLVMTGSGSFIAAPASFAFGGITAGPIKAGNNFGATITARNNAGGTTPNFGKETVAEGVTLTSTLLAPNPVTYPTANNPTPGNNVIAGASFANGVATLSNLSWGEVGSITLTATLTSGNYLASGLAASGTSASVGAFIPDHFDTAVNATATAPLPCPAGLTCPTLYNGFVYSGQPFSVQATAKNLAGGTTANYHSAYGLSNSVGLTAWDALGSVITQNPGAGVLASGSLASTAFSGGVASTSTQAYTFATSPNTPTEIYLRAVDAVNTSVTSRRATPATSIEGGVKVVSGKVKISNAHGSELLPLPMTATVQYYNGSSWVTSSTDSVTQFNTNLSTAGGNIVAAIVNGLGGGVSVATPGVVTVAGGVKAFTLNKPGVSGSVDISLNTPAYLLAGSNGAGVNPSKAGRATFGVYKGKNEFIYMRENY